MKKFALFITLLLTLTLLCGCAGLGDWSSEPLPGGYEVWRANVHGISIIKPSEPGNGGPIIIPEEVYAIRYNDNYICVQHEESTPDENDYWKEPHGNIDYYIRNDFYRYHMVLENGVLNLHDGDALVALDLVDMSSKRVCYFFSEPSILTWEAFPCCNYVYIVLENHLYFWDAILHEMVDINLVTVVKECLTKDRYWFAQVSSQGLFAIRIDELALKRIYNSISYSYLRPEVKREQWSKYTQYLFFEFQNDRDLILNYSSDKVIDLGDEDKNWMFLDKKQFILYDFVYGDEVIIYNLQ